MTDLETRLADALRDAGERAPHAGDLVAPARARLRRRRRTTAAVVAAAVAVVAIPVGASLQGGDESRDPDVAAIVPDGWRTESYRDLTLHVPEEWIQGSGSSWCDTASGEDPVPQVNRPGSADDTLCNPVYGYGVVFLDSTTLPRFVTFPKQSYQATVATANTSAHIAAESQEQLEQIRASVDTIEGVDPNGCPPRYFNGQIHGDREASVCRYGNGGWLIQSERLDRAETDALRQALLHAAERKATPPGLGARVVPEYVLVIIDGGKVFVSEESVGFNGRVVVLTEAIRSLTDMLEP